MSLTGGVISKQRWRYSFAERIFQHSLCFFFFFFLLFFFFRRFRVLFRLNGQREFCKSGLRGSGLRRFSRALAAWSWLLSFFMFSRLFFFFFFSRFFLFMHCLAAKLSSSSLHLAFLRHEFCRTAALDEDSPR